MSDPRQGRAGQANYSPRMGPRDPRLRTNQVAALTNAGLDSKSVSTDGAGRQRISAADQLTLLSRKKTPEVTELADKLDEVIATLKGINRTNRARGPNG